MNRKADEALIASILGRWNATHNPSAGTTAEATVAAIAKTRHTVGVITASQRNKTAAAYTATLTVRDSSIAGTILAQLEFLTAAAGVDRVDMYPEIPGLLGNALNASWEPPATSVIQKVQMSGWSEQVG